MVDMDIHRYSCVSMIIRLWHSIHSHPWMKKKRKLWRSLLQLWISWLNDGYIQHLSWTIGIKSQVSIIKWWTSILNDGYPLYGIRNRAYAKLFTVGFPCIHISDWQMKIMDILNSVINIHIFCNYGHLNYWICRGLFFIQSRISITELWISIIQLWDIHVIELWISINNHTCRWSFAAVFHVFTFLANKWKSMIIVKLILACGHTWLSYGYP